MSDRLLLALAIVLGLIAAAFWIFAVVLMFRAAERGDTAMTVAWGVVALGMAVSSSQRRDR